MAAEFQAQLTPDELELLWPQIHGRLFKALRSAGFDAATADDAIAEAATRALSRGLPFGDIDEFCRWGFIVARNVARDLTRRSALLVVLDAVPDQPDSYDLARDVELRQQWRDTADAIKTLNVVDRTAILDVIDGAEQPHDRRDAVKLAVRRHRARARLRAALGQAGGYFGWLRRPRRMQWEWLGAYDRAGAAVIAPLLAATVAWVSPSPTTAPVPVRVAMPSVGVPATDMSPDGTAAPVANTIAGNHTTSAAGTKLPPDAQPLPSPAPHGVGISYYSSPRYQEDGTIFATVVQREEDCAAGPCTWLFKSGDRGATWTALPAQGVGYSEIMLPPAYPQDARIFAGGQVLSVSEDGGQSFRVLGPANGPATMSPLFSAGDPRIVIGSHTYSPGPAAQYVDGDPLVKPFALPLPNGSVALEMWHSGDFARDRRFLVHAIQAPIDMVNVETGTVRPKVHEYELYSCTMTACTSALDLGLRSLITVVWTSPQTVFIGVFDGLFRSTDAGRSFTKIEPPSKRPFWTIRATPGGALLATVHEEGEARLHRSDDDAETWQLVERGLPNVNNLTVMPDGTLLGWSMDTRGMTCSTDDGRTWHPECRR